MITLARLREALAYDPRTGVFTWKVKGGYGVASHFPGEIAGTPRSAGSYIQIGVDNRRYYAHRLAWYHFYGKWPKLIDHVDRNKQNNAISNLREATVSQNGANAKVRVQNMLGVKGVRKHRKYDLYSARISTRHLGYFKTPQEAQAAYFEAAQQVYGNFARRD